MTSTGRPASLTDNELRREAARRTAGATWSVRFRPMDARHRSGAGARRVRLRVAPTSSRVPSSRTARRDRGRSPCRARPRPERRGWHGIGARRKREWGSARRGPGVRQNVRAAEDLARTSRDASDAICDGHMRDSKRAIETERGLVRIGGVFSEEWTPRMFAPTPELSPSPHEAPVRLTDRHLLRLAEAELFTVGEGADCRRVTVYLAHAGAPERDPTPVARLANFRRESRLWGPLLLHGLRRGRRPHPRSPPAPHRSISHEGAARPLPEHQRTSAAAWSGPRHGQRRLCVALFLPLSDGPPVRPTRPTHER